MAGERVQYMRFDDHSVIVEHMDGRSIATPLAWFPRLWNASADQRAVWERCAGGYGIHWLKLDEDLSTEDLLRGTPTARAI